MTTHTPPPPAPDAVRYPYPSPRAYRVRVVVRELALVAAATLGCVLATVPMVPAPDVPVQRECSVVAAYDSTGQPTPVLGHWDAQGMCP